VLSHRGHFSTSVKVRGLIGDVDLHEVSCGYGSGSTKTIAGDHFFLLSLSWSISRDEEIIWSRKIDQIRNLAPLTQIISGCLSHLVPGPLSPVLKPPRISALTLGFSRLKY